MVVWDEKKCWYWNLYQSLKNGAIIIVTVGKNVQLLMKCACQLRSLFRCLCCVRDAFINANKQESFFASLRWVQADPERVTFSLFNCFMLVFVVLSNSDACLYVYVMLLRVMGFEKLFFLMKRNVRTGSLRGSPVINVVNICNWW